MIDSKERMTDVFDRVLLMTKRDGIDNLISFLHSDTDFYTSPASTKYHGSYESGLLEHSLKVYIYATSMFKCFYSDRINSASVKGIIISSLLMRLGKANTFKIVYKNVKNKDTGIWEQVPGYEVSDNFPYGGGEKSVYIAQKFIKLEDEEAMAIRWYKCFSDPNYKDFVYTKNFEAALEIYPLVQILSMADQWACYMKNDNFIKTEYEPIAKKTGV